MKFTAVVPVTKLETKTYDIPLDEGREKVIKAYEKWSDSLKDEDMKALEDALVALDDGFDPARDDAEDFANEIIDDIRCDIYRKETGENGNDTVYDIEDILNISDGDFTLIP